MYANLAQYKHQVTPLPDGVSILSMQIPDDQIKPMMHILMSACEMLQSFTRKSYIARAPERILENKERADKQYRDMSNKIAIIFNDYIKSGIDPKSALKLTNKSAKELFFNLSYDRTKKILSETGVLRTLGLYKIKKPKNTCD